MSIKHKRTTEQPHNAYREGEVHVVSKRCSTCIFRAGNLMQLEPGRVKSMVRSALDHHSAIICHATLVDDDQNNAVCKGFFDSYKNQSISLSLAEAMDVIAYDEPCH